MSILLKKSIKIFYMYFSNTLNYYYFCFGIFFNEHKYIPFELRTVFSFAHKESQQHTFVW